jgi:brefeldin A-resistance guanine nucleotide exchange factor 1
VLNGATSGFDADLFSLIWSPAIAAMSVVFEHTDDEAVLQEVLGGFTSIAKVAAALAQTDVLDNLLSALCKFTTLLSPSSALAEDRKARMAAAAVFAIANTHGDHLRGGWRSLLDCVLRLHKLRLLPLSVTQPEGGIMTAEERAEPKAAPRGLEKRTSSTSSLLRGLSSLLSLDTSESVPAPPSEAEAAAEARTKACVAAWKVDELFAESKLLEAESLLHLVRALIWAAGRHAAATPSADDEDTALFCLEQVGRRG